MMGNFPNCSIKLCDFEISRVILEGTDIREILGTPDYVAPEILHYEPITLAADMWSLGVTTYVLLTGFSPFGGETDQETFCNISRGDLDLPEELFQDISEDAIDFIKSLIVKDPKARLTASACLKHAWLKDRAKEKQAQPPDGNQVQTERRMGCQSCGPTDSEKNLRKYLSKSREALFEKVVQRHKNNLRKTTLKSQFFNKTRLCESQISLISKSREKLLNNENMSPSFSRSIEKIYGLRSLSKSQEVLNLYRNGSLLTSQENISMVSEILKSRENLIANDDGKDRKLTRATTADLGVVRHRHRNSRMYSGSSTTSLASLATDVQEEEEEEKSAREDLKEEMKNSVDQDVKVAQEENKVYVKLNEAQTKIEKDEVVTDVKKSDEPVEKNYESSCNGNGKKEEGSTKEDIKKIDDLSKVVEQLSQLEDDKKVSRRPSEEDTVDEPRFTVAQLVTAYNKHQEIVTKTSLEVTMSAQEKAIKIPPIIPFKTKSFPTGPTALRLFIPDIDLVEMPKKSRPKYKIRFVEEKSDTSEPTSGEWRTPESSGPNSGEFDFPKEEKKPEDGSKFLRSSSLSSETSTTLSTTSGSSWEELILKEAEHVKTMKKEEQTIKLEVDLKQEQRKTDQKEELRPPKCLVLSANQKRSKSTSPSPVKEEKEAFRKLSAGSNATPSSDFKNSPIPVRKTSVTKQSAEKSPSATRKISTVEKSPLVQRKISKSSKPEIIPEVKPQRKISGGSSNYKIVGIAERNSTRKGCGVSYKIEFDSPVVSRKFPSRNIPNKSTISSELKKQDVSLCPKSRRNC